jgi:gas vesicle protein
MGLISGVLRFLLGVAAGAAGGAFVASLFAPASAEEMKRRLAARVEAVRAAGEQAERQTVASLQRSYQQKLETPAKDDDK